jgi:hypothetical protein
MNDDSKKRLAEISQKARDAHLERILEEDRLREREKERVKEEKKAKIDHEVSKHFDKFIQKHGQLKDLPFTGLKALNAQLLSIAADNDYKVIFGTLENRLGEIEKYMKKDLALRMGVLELDLEWGREQTNFFQREFKDKVFACEENLGSIFSLIIEELLYNFLNKYVASDNKSELTEELKEILFNVNPAWLKQLFKTTSRVSACASIPYIKEMIQNDTN